MNEWCRNHDLNNRILLYIAKVASDPHVYKYMNENATSSQQAPTATKIILLWRES
jgi:hypothetical protein